MSNEREFFVVANSFAAPFCSDTSERFVKAATPANALETFAAEYTHPAGLYAAAAYESADAYHKNTDPLARWLCNHEIEKQRITEHLSGYSYCGVRAGEFEIDGKLHKIEKPKNGRIVPVKGLQS